MRKINKIHIWRDGLGYRVAFFRGNFASIHNASYTQVKNLEKVLSCYGVGEIRPRVVFDIWAMVAEYEIY